MTGSGDFSLGSSLWPGLSKLIEEAAEVIQVGGKLMQRGGRVDHWSGDLREMLTEEIGDLKAAIRFFERHNDLGDTEARAALKLDRFEQWHQDNLNNGGVA